MKKVLPPQARKRALSEEERALWHAVAKTATPLRKRRKPHADVEGETPRSADVDHHQSRPVARQPAVLAAKPVPSLAPLGRKERSRLAKGRKEIDARLDLHGMTQERAHRRLMAFLHRARDDGATFVLVITGKGSGSSDTGRGILRRQVPLWLGLPELRGLVVGFEEAHIGHGGGGALYVRLRRMR